MSIDAISSIGTYASPASPYASPTSSLSSAREGSLTIGDLDPIGGITGLGRAQDPQASSSGFGEVLAGALRDVVVAEHGAVAKADALARGENDDVHGTMISAKEADISLKLVGAVRNKLLDAFHELWRTNV